MCLSLHSVPSCNWGPSTCFCWSFVPSLFAIKSSVKVDRLTVTSVSEFETDWRLVLCCSGFVSLLWGLAATNLPRTSALFHHRQIEYPVLLVILVSWKGIELQQKLFVATLFFLATYLVENKKRWILPHSFIQHLVEIVGSLVLPRCATPTTKLSCRKFWLCHVNFEKDTKSDGFVPFRIYS